MSTDMIRARDVVRQVPGLLAKLPTVAKGYYYYSIKSTTKPLSIGKIVERNVEKYADRPAILYQDFKITYREFNEWANRFAHYFRSQGIGKGDVIALYLENRPELFAALIGTTKDRKSTRLNSSHV